MAPKKSKSGRSKTKSASGGSRASRPTDAGYNFGGLKKIKISSVAVYAGKKTI
jgi:hypothetical protein